LGPDWSLDFEDIDLHAKPLGRCLNLTYLHTGSGIADIGHDRQPAETVIKRPRQRGIWGVPPIDGACRQGAGSIASFTALTRLLSQNLDDGQTRCRRRSAVARPTGDTLLAPIEDSISI
jgi:hypothetical protein